MTGSMGINRRDAIKTGAFAAAAVVTPLGRALAGSPLTMNRIASSKLPTPFSVPFVVPPVAVPVRSDATTDFYRIRMAQQLATILPGLKTPVFAYNGTVPGPTIKARRGRRVVGRFINQLPTLHPTLKYTPWTSVHLHGAASLPQYDGYANDISLPGQYKDYVYQNLQTARSIWYHDHGYHHTAENVYSGLLGSYHIEDPAENALGLPRGEFDVQLTIGDAMFNKDGSLLFSLDDHKGMWGDVILVNGRPWPVMKVKRRKYRFRLLTATVSRSFEYFLDNGDAFTIVSTDGGLVPTPITTPAIKHGSAERTDVVIDFAKYRPGQRVVLRNRSPKNNRDFVNTDRVMAFDVVADAFDPANNGPVPARLAPDTEVMNLRPEQAVITRQFELGRRGGQWVINGRTWEDVIQSGFTLVEAAPKNGDIEIWKFVNKGGGWFHPMHIHLVDFKVLDRNGKPPAAFEAGPKDVVYVGENEEVRVLTRFVGAGRYMVHCHNVIHEDHDMMVQYRVVNPAGEPDPLGTPAIALPERSAL